MHGLLALVGRALVGPRRDVRVTRMNSRRLRVRRSGRCANDRKDDDGSRDKECPRAS